MTDLRECPFCGGGAEIEQVGTRWQSQIIACTYCGCRLESTETRIDANIQWNRRAEPDHQLSMEPVKVSISPNALGKMGDE